MLLSERELSEKNATAEERASALESLIQRYRHSRGSEVVHDRIANCPETEAFDLEKAIIQAFEERSPRPCRAVRRSTKVTVISALFTGKYSRADGTELVFPNDGIGHTCLLFFWSETPRIPKPNSPNSRTCKNASLGSSRSSVLTSTAFQMRGQQFWRRGLDAIPSSSQAGNTKPTRFTSL